jgi:hypothetical protein
VLSREVTSPVESPLTGAAKRFRIGGGGWVSIGFLDRPGNALLLSQRINRRSTYFGWEICFVTIP